jgi:hypothetical protein
MEKQSNEQPIRKYPRFMASPRAVVFFPKSPESLPCHIIDISEGGLSFRYLGETNKPSGTCSISLYHEYELIVGDLPAQAVSDNYLRNGFVPVRRGSLRFDTLSIEQRNKLSTFIDHFTEPLH